MALDLLALSEFLQKGRAKEVTELVQQGLDEGMSAKTILQEGLMHGMNIIGEKFKNNEVFVPEVLIAARAMNMGTALLKPFLVDAGVKATGKVVIGTVKGDLHDIGKNLVAMMMEGKGLEVIDLGSDVPPQKYVEEAVNHGADIIACSALLTTTMTQMKDVVAAADQAGIRDRVKIMVGGAPVTQSFCDSIGADYYTADAASAAQQATAICAGH
jgi:corrinoid protein of di/trimethylamine methyltransferase